MKFYATSFCQTQWVDRFAQAQVLNKLEGLHGWEQVRLDQADVILYVFTWRHEFLFDEDEFKAAVARKIPLIVLDYLEHDCVEQLTVLGTVFDPRHCDRRYEVVHMHLRDYLPPARYFKRELPKFAATAYPKVRPLDFTTDDFPEDDNLQTEDKFMARPIDILMIYGSSHPARCVLAGELLKQVERFNAYPYFALTTGDLDYNLKTHRRCQIATLYQNAYWNRLPMAQVMAIQRLAKISISCRGAGIKCFRSAEAGYNAILAQQDVNKVQWAFPWNAQGKGLPTHETLLPNCINLPGKDETIDASAAVDELYKWICEQGWLYPIYKLGTANNQNYRSDKYLARYLVPEITAAL